MGEDKTPQAEPPQAKPTKIVAEPQAAAFLHAHGYDEPLELHTEGMPCPGAGLHGPHSFAFTDPIHLDDLEAHGAYESAERARKLGISAFAICDVCDWVEPVYEATDDQIPEMLRELVDKLRNLAEEDQ